MSRANESLSNGETDETRSAVSRPDVSKHLLGRNPRRTQSPRLSLRWNDRRVSVELEIEGGE